VIALLDCSTGSDTFQNAAEFKRPLSVTYLDDAFSFCPEQVYAFYCYAKNFGYAIQIKAELWPMAHPQVSSNHTKASKGALPENVDFRGR
jgi:hypothetical protein